jgi:hypothetical protein
MRTSKFCWIKIDLAFIVALTVVGCASLNSPYSANVSISAQDSSYADVFSPEKQRAVFKSFCSGQRQIKVMKLSFSFVSPKNPKGAALDAVSERQSQVETKRACLFRDALYELGDVPCTQMTTPKSCGPELRRGFSFVSTSAPGSVILEDAKAAELGGTEPVFVISEGQKKIVGFFGQPTQTSEGPRWYGVSGKYAGTFRRDAVLYDIGALVNGFTILEPSQYQEETYGSGELLSCQSEMLAPMRSHSDHPIAVNDDGSVNLSEALDERESIWRRYIIRHSKIKESKAPDPQLTNVEVSLDLNDFCRYGRSVGDLTSQ